MNSLLDNDVDTSTNHPPYPMTDLVRTYLQQTGSKFFGPGVARREEPAPQTTSSRAEELWDYLGDFA